MCQQETLAPLPRKGSAFSLSATEKPTVPTITWRELAHHNTLTDAWIAIKGRVYDVTQFSKLHPGGDIIFTAAGGDATDVFAAFHASTDAWKLLPALCVANIDAPVSPILNHVDKNYISDVLDLRAHVQRLRLFDSSKLFYMYKILSNLSICALSVAIALNTTSYIATILAALFMALFWQQCGWLAHDFLHHQVFLNRNINNVFGLFIGNIFQGFSVSWWKNKHNHHHAVPNVVDAPGGGDPDIATVPILFWSEKLIEGEQLDALPMWMLRNQAVLYFPILCMARISWLTQSLLHQLPKRNPHVTSAAFFCSEIFCLALHHFAFLYLLLRISQVTTLAHAVVFCAFSQAFGGVLLGLVFAVGHNAMDVLTSKEMRNVDFVRLQTRTTRNVDPHWFSDWFTGGLSYQVEHHIFPTVPRHHLPKLAPIFRRFCQKHDIPYTSQTLVEGNRAVCQILKAVSKTAV